MASILGSVMSSCMSSNEEWGGKWLGNFNLFIHKKNGKPPVRVEDDEKDQILAFLGSRSSYSVQKLELFASEIPHPIGYVENVILAYENMTTLWTGAAVGVDAFLETFRKPPNFKGFSEEMKKRYAEQSLRQKASTSAWIHHDFVVFQLLSDEGVTQYASLEKFSHGIVMQVAPEKDTLMNFAGTYNRHEQGRQVFLRPLEVDDCKENLKVGEIVTWVFDDKELEKPYKILPPMADHCQHFAERLMINFAKSKTYPEVARTKAQIFYSIVEQGSVK